jgi:hypothetical protein
MRLQGRTDRTGWLVLAIVGVAIVAVIAYLVFFTTIL